MSYVWCVCVSLFFFFQAEDGIRDVAVTGVQTCALPIYIKQRLKIAVGGADPVRCEQRRGHSPSSLRSEEHTSELQSRLHLVCRLLLEKKKYTPEAPGEVIRALPPTTAAHIATIDAATLC